MADFSVIAVNLSLLDAVSHSLQLQVLDCLSLDMILMLRLHRLNLSLQLGYLVGHGLSLGLLTSLGVTVHLLATGTLLTRHLLLDHFLARLGIGFDFLDQPFHLGQLLWVDDWHVLQLLLKLAHSFRIDLWDILNE